MPSNRWTSFLDDLPAEGVTDGNRVVHLPEDEHAVRAIWEDIEQADERVWISMYTLDPDEIGMGTLERMAEAARRGVDVRLVYDYVGSFSLRQKHLAPLREAGGHAVRFHPVWRFWKKHALTVRNHRKLIITDRTAICGGLNLSSDYVGGPFGEWVFDDTKARVEGPCVRDLAAVFQHTWEEMTGEPLSLPARSEPFPDGASVAVMETDPRRTTSLDRVLATAIRRAETRCYLSTPYFVPPPWLYEALLDATRRDVDVRVLTAGQTDRAVARWAGWHCYPRLLAAGVRIYELFGRILHSKTMTIDGQFGSIGSYNMDAWTTRHTLDLNMLIASEDIAASLEDEFFEDVDDAREITKAACREQSGLHQLLCRATDLVYRTL